MEYQQLQHMVEEAHNNKPHIGVIAAVAKWCKISNKRTIPDFGAPKAYELPDNCWDAFRHLIEEYNDLFRTTLGKTRHMIVITFQLRVPQFMYHLGVFWAIIEMKLSVSWN